MKSYFHHEILKPNIFLRNKTGWWAQQGEKLTSIIQVTLQPVLFHRIALAEVSHKTFSLLLSYPNAGMFQTTNENFYENQDIM